jgi:hypothetical protein
MALLVVLVILLAVGSSSASFIWFMNQQQARAGTRYRAAAAVAAAEAGVHRALSVLEGAVKAPDGADGRTWRPAGHTERMRADGLEGSFTLTLSDAEGGAILVTSVGHAGGVSRRLRARVFLPTPTLLAAIYGASLIRIEKAPSALVLRSYGHPGDRPWIHMAAGRGIWFAGNDVSLNDPAVIVEAGPGPVDPPGTPAITRLAAGDPARVLLARDAELLIGADRRRLEIEQLHEGGIRLAQIVVRDAALPAPPEVDGAYYQALAAASRANAALNEAVGTYLGDADLARKADSLYTTAEFQRVLTYLRSAEPTPVLRGLIYISGNVAISDGQRVRITDGALVTEGTVVVGPGAALEVTHSAATRTLPGVVVAREGALVLSAGATLRAHGLVYASRVIDLGEDAVADIVGAVVGADRGLSIRTLAATLVVRYDPAVLGTPGLRVAPDAPVIAWIAQWEELP